MGLLLVAQEKWNEQAAHVVDHFRVEGYFLVLDYDNFVAHGEQNSQHLRGAKQNFSTLVVDVDVDVDMKCGAPFQFHSILTLFETLPSLATPASINFTHCSTKSFISNEMSAKPLSSSSSKFSTKLNTQSRDFAFAEGDKQSNIDLVWEGVNKMIVVGDLEIVTIN